VAVYGIVWGLTEPIIAPDIAEKKLGADAVKYWWKYQIIFSIVSTILSKIDLPDYKRMMTRKNLQSGSRFYMNLSRQDSDGGYPNLLPAGYDSMNELKRTKTKQPENHTIYRLLN
jgi:hypothetical protein